MKVCQRVRAWILGRICHSALTNEKVGEDSWLRKTPLEVFLRMGRLDGFDFSHERHGVLILHFPSVAACCSGYVTDGLC